MPKIDKIFSLEITPEQFLNNCSDLELQELDILIQGPRFANRINALPKLPIIYCCECKSHMNFKENSDDSISCTNCGTKRNKP